MKVRFFTGTLARAVFAAPLLLATVGAGPALADHDGGPPPATAYVGTCKAGSYPTIGAAITAAPAGATILVCPGIYPEQVTITKPLTVEGIQSNNHDAAIITGTSTVNANDFDASTQPAPIIAQILVQNTSNVNLINLTTDGSSNTLGSC